MCTTIVSALLQLPVRRDVAMTGEITLRGRVKAIGGLKEKLLAAHRGGIQTVFIPKENEPEIDEIPKKVRAALEIIPVDHMDQVVRQAFAVERPEEVLQGLPEAQELLPKLTVPGTAIERDSAD